MEAERVWLVHRDGFAPAGLLKNDKDNKDNDGNEDDMDEGKVRVQLDYNGDIIEVKTVLVKCITFFCICIMFFCVSLSSLINIVGG